MSTNANPYRLPLAALPWPEQRAEFEARLAEMRRDALTAEAVARAVAERLPAGGAETAPPKAKGGRPPDPLIPQIVAEIRRLRARKVGWKAVTQTINTKFPDRRRKEATLKGYLRRYKDESVGH